jgi:hypothetical protein
MQHLSVCLSVSRAAQWSAETLNSAFRILKKTHDLLCECPKTGNPNLCTGPVLPMTYLEESFGIHQAGPKSHQP